MNAKRKPFPCRLGIHNYIRQRNGYECICGAVRECPEGEHDVVAIRRVNVPDSEYTQCRRCGKFGVSEFELTDYQRNRMLMEDYRRRYPLSEREKEILREIKERHQRRFGEGSS